jgi:hypothetical protein
VIIMLQLQGHASCVRKKNAEFHPLRVAAAPSGSAAFPQNHVTAVDQRENQRADKTLANFSIRNASFFP